MLTRSSKWNGGCIKALTQVSRTIQCSKSLLTSKVFRNGSDYILTGEDYENAAAVIRSKAIDRALQEDATALRRETKIVLMGANQSGKHLIMRQMKALYAGGYYTIEERISYCQAVRSTIRLLIQAIIDLLEDAGISLTEDLTRDYAILLQEVETTNAQQITAAGVQAVENIWASPIFIKLYIRNIEIHFPQYASYFAHEISKISKDDYVPSEADIMRLHQVEGGIKELRFDWDELDVHLFNIGGRIPHQFHKRWFHQLEGTASLVYIVDVSLYDKPLLSSSTTTTAAADTPTSWLQNELTIFEELVNWDNLADSSIILILNNFTRFCEKQKYTPLSTMFPDYTPSSATDPTTSARQYILRRFKQLNHSDLPLYSFWVDLDSADNQALYAALKKSLLHTQQLKASKEVMSMGAPARDVLPREGSKLTALLTRSFSSSVERWGAGGIQRSKSVLFGEKFG